MSFDFASVLTKNRGYIGPMSLSLPRLFAVCSTALALFAVSAVAQTTIADKPGEKSAIKPVRQPTGHAMSPGIEAILKSGGYRFSFTPPSAGRLAIHWSRNQGRHRPELIGTLNVTLHRAGRTRLKLRLTSSGRALLNGSGPLALTAEATFTPDGTRGVVVRKTFTLR